MPEHRRGRWRRAGQSSDGRGASRRFETWLCRRCGRPSAVGTQRVPGLRRHLPAGGQGAMIAAAPKKRVEEEKPSTASRSSGRGRQGGPQSRSQGYERRRSRRASKDCPGAALPSITRDFAMPTSTRLRAGCRSVSDTVPLAKPAGETPLLWTDEAVQRMERVRAASCE